MTSLAREFPEKSEAELVHAVVFCKGAVQRNQGFHNLQFFVSRLLQNTRAKAVPPARGAISAPPIATQR